MSGHGHGGHPDEYRRRQMAELRAKGLTYAEVGRRFGVTASVARYLVERSGLAGAAVPVRCPACGGVAGAIPRPRWGGQEAVCAACLAGRPGAGLGARLRADRVARGLTLAALARLVGVTAAAVSQYESGARRPGARTLRRLAEVLGPGLLGGSGPGGADEG
jgi:transcriptional regulator with XRE-family HTH domain